MGDEMVIERNAAQHCTTEQAAILWQAFSLRGVGEDLPKKAAIAREFKSNMREAVVFHTNRSTGELEERPDPRGGLAFHPRKGALLAFTPEQSDYLLECLKELKSKNEGGKPVIDSTVADDVQHVETVLLANWKAGRGDAEALLEAAGEATRA